jgi:hypothetical protein
MSFVTSLVYPTQPNGWWVNLNDGLDVPGCPNIYRSIWRGADTPQNKTPEVRDASGVFRWVVLPRSYTA